MFSGNDLECGGGTNTGLSPGDSDLFEGWNCDNTKNGYAAIINAEAGDEYVIIVGIYAFMNTIENPTFTIDWCGSASFINDDTVCEDMYVASIDHRFSDINITPNPASNFLTIDGDLQNIDHIDIYNINGYQVIKDKKIKDKNINIEHLKSGLYLLQLVSKEGTVIHHQKVIVVK
ncbi:MAG: T9SS type A sorting domain-containing protein [Saprospiraceae bacterium]